MPILLRVVVAVETAPLLPILLDADEDEMHVRTKLSDPLYTAYAALLDEEISGAALVRWQEDESEIEYIAVLPDLRGRGYGKAIMNLLLAEAQQRHVKSLLVGTDNTAFDNIAFYQKCGFRMYSVRHDYFSYIQPPITHNGIVLRDMLVLRYVFEDNQKRL